MSKVTSQVKFGGHCVFADDIRVENTGKEIYVGVYERDMIVPILPIKLDNLTIKAKLVMPFEQPIKEYKLLVELPGVDEPLILESKQINLPVREAITQDSRYQVTAIMKMAPLEIKKEGVIRVRAFTDQGELTLGTLKVQLRQQEATPDDLFMSLIYYQQLLPKLSKTDQGLLAKEILDIFSDKLPAPKGGIDTHILIRLSENMFKVFYSDPKKEHKLKVEVQPAGAKYKIIHQNKFGCILSFEEGSHIEELTVF